MTRTGRSKGPLAWAARTMARCLLLALACCQPQTASARRATPPLVVKVVILTTFEIGKDKGDLPGEFQAFAEHMHWAGKMVVPGIEHPVYYSRDGVVGVVTGMRARPRESLAALIGDRRLDVSHAYWILAGIAGVDPRAASIGSAAWAAYVVDGDPVFEMDDREIPKDWPYGIYALGTDRPDQRPSAAQADGTGLQNGSSGMVWKIDSGLLSWAYRLTSGIKLDDNADLAKARAGYVSEPMAQKPPFVLIGDALGTVRFWHGERRTSWARNWVRVWTGGAGHFVMSACEEQGIMDVLTIYGAQHKLDPRRVLILRTASNYTREADGADPVLREFKSGGAAAAFEAAYRVTNPVVKALVADWSRYRTTLPGHDR